MSQVWEGTGLYATDAERKELAELIESVKSAPLVKFRSDGPTLPELGQQAIMALCKKIAIAHGLPERAEDYGVDINSGQIIQ